VLSFVPFRPEREAEALVAWLSREEWPFHGSRRPEPARVRGWLEAGRFHGREARSFWLRAGEETAGLLALQDLLDPTPVFDLRVAAAWRRRGVGRRALAWLAERVFVAEDRARVEAHTRADNAPMRALLRAAGWVHEAHHRQAWPDEAGALHDAVTYALLRADWARGARTPVPPLEP
jgi:RimJ/RimL family protein N-acetyltransferase